MESPKFRNKISLSAGMKNQGLRDILTPTQGGVRVESVSEFESPLHNTKVVIVIEKDEDGNPILEAMQERRTIHYNRVDVSTILPIGAALQATTIEGLINELNIKHRCDFTTDDLELVDGLLKAKSTSLGYYGVMTEAETDHCALAKPSVRLLPRLPYFKSDESSYQYHLKIDGVLVTSSENLVEAEYDLRNFLSDFLPNGIGMKRGPEDNPWQQITNLTQRCIRFEIIPVTPLDTVDLPADIFGNQTFEISPTGSILFNLSPFVSACNLQYAKELLIKPKNYNFKTFDNLAIFYKMAKGTKLVSYGYINVPVGDLYGWDNAMVPNHPELTAPLLINSQYPSLGNFFEGIDDAIGNRYSVGFSIPEIIQLSPVKRIAYLGCYRSAVVPWGTSMRVRINEVIITDALLGTSKETTLGDFVFTATNINDAMSQIYTYYKPIFESKGYVVEPYNISNPFTLTSSGFKLTKTSTDPAVFLKIKFDDTDNILHPGWGNFETTHCYFQDSEVIGSIITEEDVKDKVSLFIRPIEPSDGGSINFIPETTHLELITKEQYLAEGAPDPDILNMYDWIKENHSGQTLIIDSCGAYGQIAM